MVTLDRIRLTGLLRKKPWQRGFFYGCRFAGDWLVNRLIRTVGLAPDEVAAMSEREAHECLNEFYSQPKE